MDLYSIPDERKGDESRSRESFSVGCRLVCFFGSGYQLSRVAEKDSRPPSVLSPDEATVYNITVLSIEQGTVTPEDLALDFPEGLRQLRPLRGSSTAWGQMAKRRTSNPWSMRKTSLAGADASLEAEATEREANPMRFYLLLINGEFIPVVMAFLFRRQL